LAAPDSAVTDLATTTEQQTWLLQTWLLGSVCAKSEDDGKGGKARGGIDDNQPDILMPSQQQPWLWPRPCRRRSQIGASFVPSNVHGGGSSGSHAREVGRTYWLSNRRPKSPRSTGPGWDRLPEIRLLRKSGFRRLGEGREEGTGRRGGHQLTPERDSLAGDHPAEAMGLDESNREMPAAVRLAAFQHNNAVAILATAKNLRNPSALTMQIWPFPTRSDKHRKVARRRTFHETPDLLPSVTSRKSWP